MYKEPKLLVFVSGPVRSLINCDVSRRPSPIDNRRFVGGHSDKESGIQWFCQFSSARLDYVLICIDFTGDYAISDTGISKACC